MRLLGKALTFDDVLLVPAYLPGPAAATPRLATRLSRNIALNLPLVSAAMDTVTEARLAIAIAQEGGIGIVHKNLTPQQQAAEVAKVKRYESGVLRDPITITPDTTVRAGDGAVASSTASRASRCCDGGKVVGIVTGRDLRFETRCDAPVREIMTPRERLVTVREGATLDEGQGADAQAQAGARAGGQRRLRAQGPDHGQGHHQADQLSRMPRATRRASCAWARRWAWARAPRSGSKLLVKAGVDAIVVDTAHGHSKGVIERVRWVKQQLSRRST